MLRFLLSVVILLVSIPLPGWSFLVPASEHGVRGDAGDGLQTDAIQRALDAAGRLAAERGEPAVVRLPQGRIRSGALFFRADNVSLEIPEGCTLAGSTDWRDYGDGAWTDAFLSARGRRNIGLIGAGTLDCGGPENPNGEEKYRGPHALRLSDCSGILLRDVTIRDAGNYAVCCWNGTDIALEGVTVLGGHDGLHAQNCRGLRLARCDFRTGDDCVAGADNLDVVVERCRFNSSCNAFRAGGLRLRNDGTAPLLRVRVSDLVEWTGGILPEESRMELDDIRDLLFEPAPVEFDDTQALRKAY